MKLSDRISAFLYRKRLRGATRFHSICCRGRRIEVNTSHQIRLFLDPFEYIDHRIIQYGYYEQEVLQAIESALCPGQVFWDIGANLGIHSLTIKSHFPDSTVYAFEPNPAMAQLISKAADHNRLEIDLHQIALDAENGTADFYRHPGNAGRNGLHNWENDATLEAIQVSTFSGDYLISRGQAAPPHVIKIDVEGHEAQVLAGLTSLLAGDTLHSIIFEDSKDPASAVKCLLEQHHFRVSPLSRLEPTHHNLENYQATR